MGNTVEQHRSAIGRFNLSRRHRECTKIMRGLVLSEIMAILAVAQIRREAEQVSA